MTLSLFRISFLVMLERTLTQFMKNAFQVEILRSALLDHLIKVLALILVFLPWWGETPSLIASGLLGALLFIRFLFWSPRKGLSRIDIGVMYLGYLGIIIQLIEPALREIFNISWVGAVPTHLFTTGVMGLIIPAMIIRISNGHTGRRVQFDRVYRLGLWLMVLGLLFRVAIPQVFPEGYRMWVSAAALIWFFVFLMMAVRLIPFLLAPRIDGKIH